MSQRTKPKATIPVGAIQTSLGESPVWLDKIRTVAFVDIDCHSIHLQSVENGDVRSLKVPGRPGFLAAVSENLLIVGVECQIWTFDPRSLCAQLLIELTDEFKGTRFNDAGVSADGFLWIGTMVPSTAPETETASVYKLDEIGLKKVLGGFRTVNGIAIDSSGFLHVSDSEPSRRSIWRSKSPSPTGWSDMKLIHVTVLENGRPDGAVFDSADNYWFAGIDAGRLVQISNCGRVDQSIQLPIKKPTKFVFGGHNTSTIYVTSMGPPRFGSPNSSDGRILKLDIPAVGAVPRYVKYYPRQSIRTEYWGVA